MKLLAALLAILLTGCTTISHNSSPADWPRLTIREHRIQTAPLVQTCYSAVPLWMKLLGGIPEGCAFIDFAGMTCDIYIHEDSASDDRVRLHELEHCAGRDHLGGSDLADAWEAWKARMLKGASRYYYVRHDGETATAMLTPKKSSQTIFDALKQEPRFDPPKRQSTIFD